MKVIPVIKNVNWNGDYTNVPYFTDKTIDKTTWLLNKYCNGALITDGIDNLKIIRENVSTGSITMSLKQVNKIPGYESLTKYDLWKCNYLITDEGQFYFVNEVVIQNDDICSFLLELDTWMTNIDNTIINDGKQRYIKRGHAKRLKKTPAGYIIDYDLNNPNWNPINEDNLNKEITNASVLTSFPKDMRPFVNSSGNVVITGEDNIRDVLNEFYWLTLFVPIPKTSNSAAKVNYRYGVKIKGSNAQTTQLPYQLRSVPLAETKLGIIPVAGLQMSDDGNRYYDAWSQGIMNEFAQTDSEIVGAVITRGLFPGYRSFKCDANSKLEISNTGDGYFKLRITPGSYEYVKGQNAAIKILDLEEQKTNVGVLSSNNYSNSYKDLDIFQSQKWLKAQQSDNNIFDKDNYLRRFNKTYSPTSLSKDNPRNPEYEPYMYSKQLLDIRLVGTQENIDLSYQLLEGQLPIISKSSFFDNGVLQENKYVETGKYKDRKYSGVGLVENINIVFPTSTSAYQQYLLQNQSNRTGEIIGTVVSGAGGIGLGAAGGFAAGSKAGPIGAVAGAVFGALGGGLNAGLSAGKIKSKELDIQRQPNKVNNSNNNGVTDIINNLDNGYDYITISDAIDSDKAYYYEEIYRKGCIWDFAWTPDFDTRYHFNFWQIEDIKETLDISGLSPAEILRVNEMFNVGVRLFHIRDIGDDFDPNNFEKENLEMEIVNG